MSFHRILIIKSYICNCNHNHNTSPMSTPIIISGAEPFQLAGESAGFTVGDFWQFQFSNVWDMQQEIAEFIVAKALGQEQPHNKNGWTLWDISYRGKRIEVKETAYYHSWRKDGAVSEQRVFGITKAYSRYKDNSSTFERQNDVYVFCLNTGYTRESSNPLVLDNWRFWVVPTSTINKLCGDNKKISLNRLKSFTKQPDGIGFSQLKAAVDQYC